MNGTCAGYNANGGVLPEYGTDARILPEYCPNTEYAHRDDRVTEYGNPYLRKDTRIRYTPRYGTAGVNTLAIMLKACATPSRVGPSASRAVARTGADRTVRRVPVTNAPPHAAAAERHKMTAESNGRHIAAPCGGTATGARATINVRTRARAPYRTGQPTPSAPLVRWPTATTRYRAGRTGTARSH